jgi:PAS domain S-box-containing protein
LRAAILLAQCVVSAAVHAQTIVPNEDAGGVGPFNPDPATDFVAVAACIGAIAVLTWYLARWSLALHRRADALELSLRERSVATILDQMGDGIITIDEKGIVATINSAAERMFGYAAAEVVGRNVAMLMPEEMRAAHDTYVRSANFHGVRVLGRQRTLRGVRKDGSVFDLELCVSMMSLPGRRGFVGVCRDETEARERERRLEASEARLRSLAANVPGYLWQRVHRPGKPGQVTFTSERVRRILGYAPEEIMAMPKGVASLAVDEDEVEEASGGCGRRIPRCAHSNRTFGFERAPARFVGFGRSASRKKLKTVRSCGTGSRSTSPK